MIKKTVVLGLVSIGSVSAQAQSSVTLYGVVDAGIAYTNNQGGASNIQQTSGKLSGSRWGLKGARISAAACKRSSRWKAGSGRATAGSARAAACSAAPRTWVSARKPSAR